MVIHTSIKRLIPHALIAATTVLTAIAAVAPAQAFTFYSNRAAFNAATSLNFLQNIDFEDLHTSANDPIGYGYTYYGDATITSKGVQFTGDQYKFVQGGDPGGASYSSVGLGSSDVLYSVGSRATESGSFAGTPFFRSYDNLLSILLPANTTAVAFDFQNTFAGTTSDIFKISINDQVFDFNFSYNQSSNFDFVGFISDTAIQSIQFVGTSIDSSSNFDGLSDYNGDGVIDSNDTNSYTRTGTVAIVRLDNLTFGQVGRSVPEPASILGLLTLGAFGAASQIKRKQHHKV